MYLDPATPVIVGVGQLTLHRKPGIPSISAIADAEPAEMMARSIHLAAADAGPSGSLIQRVDEIDTVKTLSWDYFNPGKVLAKLLGISPANTAVSTIGGDSPLALVSRAAARIAQGKADTVIVAGAEAVYTRRKMNPSGSQGISWSRRDLEGTPPPEEIGESRPGSHPYELEQSLALPVNVYPIFETAIRHRLGLDPLAHLDRISKLWSRFSAVAATNKYAWSQQVQSPAEISEVSATNRMVSYPYTKLLTANIQVDQAAAIILTSAGTAEALSIPKDRWIFPVASAFAHDYWFVSERSDLTSSPAIGAIARACFGQAGVTLDDISKFDLYSCFPSAVEIACLELGIDPLSESRPLTMTGGLTFAGGPGNNYASHSLAQMVGAIREDPESLGMVTGVGWYMTKHHSMILSGSPVRSVGGFSTLSAQPGADQREPRRFGRQSGPVTIEAYTIVYDREGNSTRAICACLAPDGSRVWAGTTDAHLLSTAESIDVCGRAGEVSDTATVAF